MLWSKRKRLVWKRLALLVGTLCVLPAASLADSTALPSSALQRQIEQIDQEIFLLRAELAQGNGDRSAVERYVAQLRQMALPESFAPRLAQLEAFVAQPPAITESAGLAEAAEVTTFKLPNPQSTVVVLLPLSGDYAVAGERVLAGLRAEWPFNRAFEVIDSALYDNVFQLWELVKLYSPDLVIGPLVRERALAWQALNTGLPTLYLNQLAHYAANEKALSPSKQDGLPQLHRFIDTYALQRVLVLHQESSAGKMLAKHFQQAGSDFTGVMLEQAAVGQSLDQAMRRALNIETSAGRKSWLQSTVQRELSFEPRARQDFDAVLSFLPLNTALQVQPMLRFYHLNEALHLWYPPDFPSAAELLASLPFWQQTNAFLTPYSIPDSAAESAENLQNEQTGLLYALGRLAANLMTQPDALTANKWLGQTAIGTLMTNADAQWLLLPEVYWLNDKRIQPLTEYRFQFD